MTSKKFSVIEYYSKQEKYQCGYCKSSDTNCSYGMTAQSLSVQHYQNLIDRGWRRSGRYCYKPMMNVTCCPHYTIKCDALEFTLTKSQKKIMKKLIKFIKNDITQKDKETSQKYCSGDLAIRDIPNYSRYADRAEKIDISVEDLEVLVQDQNAGTSRDTCTTLKKLKTSSTNSTIVADKEKIHQVDVQTIYASKGPQRKAKILRIEKKRQKLILQGKTEEEIEIIMKSKKKLSKSKSLEDLMEEIQKCPNKLQIRLVRTHPMNAQYKQTSLASFELFKKYQISVHGDEISKLTEHSYHRFLVRSPLLLKLIKVLSDECISTLQESAKLFKKYQFTIHNDRECEEGAYISFLVTSPLQAWIPENNLPEGYGSFHEQYWLNGELIAVCVIDILPSCLSSVYFFYDPAYSFLSLGTFSSLREIYLTRKFNKIASDLKYYYMGYYIHTCPKMRYKAKIKPSFILCPETYVWFDIDKCLPKLDLRKYCRFNEDPSNIDEDAQVNIEEVPILFRKQIILFKIFKKYIQDLEVEEQIKEYASLVGRNCASEMLFYID